MLRPLISLAVRSLLLHKLRSLLTVLGLVFGVASVIIMLAVGEGASFEAQQQIQALGATNIIIKSKKPIEDTKSRDDGGVIQYGLTYPDVARIKETVPTVVDVTPQREFRQEIRYVDRRSDCRVAGVTPNFLRMNTLEIADGRFIEDDDLRSYRNICVLGFELAERLFPFENPLGKSVRVGPQHYYRIIGITHFRAPSAGIGSSLAAQDYNLDCYIPLTTDRARFGELLAYGKQGTFTYERIELSQITVEVHEIDQVRPTSKVLESLLLGVHPKNDFAVTVPLELLEQAKATKRIFNIVLGSTAAISLLVGGIGIMNIMLATVTERTREIGIRRALGAKRRDIVTQFLVETAVLSMLGSVLGTLIGLAAPELVSWLSGVKTIITLWSILAAVSVSLLVGIGFGVFPAFRAARMDPIEALRAD